MLPDDLLREITSYLNVQDSLTMEVAVCRKVYDRVHYKSIWYNETYVKTYDLNNRKIYIETFRINNIVYSVVRTRPSMQFVIQHKEEISTRKANKKAYEAMIIRDSKVLSKRLEMIGIEI